MTTNRAKFMEQETRVGDNQTLYDALRERKMLIEPNDSSWLGHLVRDGELGLSSDNGKAVFLAPGGRHILWSPLHTYKGNVRITDKKITLNNITIITIDNSENGLSKKPGHDIILEPGQHILELPQTYIESKPINQNYVKLGTHHRISVPVNYVAIAYNEGKKIIITPDELEVDEEHKQYVVCTKGEIYKIQSPTFTFDEKTGFKSTQLEDFEVPVATYNTREGVTLTIASAIRYRIDNPVKAFLTTDDVLHNMKEQAKSTLNSVFSQLSVNEIATSIATTNISHMKSGKGKGEDVPQDMLHHATDLFMKEFESIVKIWGVEAKLINITSLQLDERMKEIIKKRTQELMEAETQTLIVEKQTSVAMQKAQREKDIVAIQADARAIEIKTNADAELYAAKKRVEAAKLLSQDPLATELAILNAKQAIAKELGSKATVITTDSNIGLGQLRYNQQKGHTLLFSPKQNRQNREDETLDQDSLFQRIPQQR